jgi:hypothetical protein
VFKTHGLIEGRARADLKEACTALRRAENVLWALAAERPKGDDLAGHWIATAATKLRMQRIEVNVEIAEREGDRPSLTAVR